MIDDSMSKPLYHRRSVLEDMRYNLMNEMVSYIHLTRSSTNERSRRMGG
jgi:hypothetical protein